MCLNAECVNSPLAPKDNCPFGDDLVSNEFMSSNFGITLTSNYSTCQQVFEFMQQNNLSIADYCNNTYFNSMCCQSCKSDFFLN